MEKVLFMMLVQRKVTGGAVTYVPTNKVRMTGFSLKHRKQNDYPKQETNVLAYLAKVLL